MQINGRIVVVSALAAAALLAGRLGALPRGDSSEGGVAGGVGPDVIVGSLPDISKYGTVGGISAYSIGTTSCNIGSAYLLWCDTSVAGLCTQTQHPVIAQNIYRLANGRMEMVGMSWLKHGFCALSGSLCSPCQADPFGCDALGVGCSDPYSSGLNGNQSGLGPRSQVNPHTGIFPYPFSAPAAPATIGRRIQVPMDALDPAMNPGARYFGEGHYIAADDAAAGNSDNNAAYRQLLVGAFTSGSWTLSLTGSTIQQRHAIHAWRDHGLGTGVPDPNVIVQNVDVRNDGRFIVAYKVSDNGDGTWHYEYAVFNQDSDRGAMSWHIPVPAGVTVTNQGQTIVNHHSGEPYSTTPWTMSAPSGGLLWSTQSHAANPNANALRWSTMFNFRFDADQPPVAGSAAMAFFKPGNEAEAAINVLVPQAPACLADVNDDGVVDGDDISIVLGAWFDKGGDADLNEDGIVDGNDLTIVLGGWGDC